VWRHDRVPELKHEVTFRAFVSRSIGNFADLERYDLYGPFGGGWQTLPRGAGLILQYCPLRLYHLGSSRFVSVTTNPQHLAKIFFARIAISLELRRVGRSI